MKPINTILVWESDRGWHWSIAGHTDGGYDTPAEALTDAVAKRLELMRRVIQPAFAPRPADAVSG